LKIVSKRRRIMKYLRDKDENRYQILEAKIKEYQAANK
jgi:ribosomal protein S15P/S13E